MKRVACLLLAFVLLASPLVRAQSVKPAERGGPAADFVAPGPIVPLPPPVGDAVKGLRAADLAAHIEFLAAPALGGRGLGREGLEAAAEYVASSLALAGIAPAAGVGETGAGRSWPREAYFQAVPIREFTNARGRLTVERGAAATASRAGPATPRT